MFIFIEAQDEPQVNGVATEDDRTEDQVCLSLTLIFLR